MDFTVTDLECEGTAGASNTLDIELLHHDVDVDWTYHATAFVPGAATGSIGKMSDVYSSEDGMTNGEPFAFKLVDLSTTILGSSSDGIIWKITVGAVIALDHMNCFMGYREGLL
jgi:hypothetical protein